MPIPITVALEENAAVAADKAAAVRRAPPLPAVVGPRRRLRRHRRRPAAVGQRPARRRRLRRGQARPGRRVRHRPDAGRVRRRRAVHRQRHGHAAGLVALDDDAGPGARRARRVAGRQRRRFDRLRRRRARRRDDHRPGRRSSWPSIVTAKDAATGPQLFWRSVLCNALVCLALWMAARTRSDAAKLVVLWWALLAFIASGFEHSIANATTFALAAFDGSHRLVGARPQPAVDRARQHRRRRPRRRPRLRLARRLRGPGPLATSVDAPVADRVDGPVAVAGQ